MATENMKDPVCTEIITACFLFRFTMKSKARNNILKLQGLPTS